jgi:hypothetical protein
VKPADRINTFYEESFNPYLKFHRPCGVPELKPDQRGKTRRIYKWYAAPWEILRRLPGLPGYLKPDLTIDQLDRIAGTKSDTQAAVAMQEAKRKLFAKHLGPEGRMKKRTGCGNDGQWKARKTKGRFSVPSHSPWKSQDDFHIPAAPAHHRHGKVEI